MYSSPNYCMTTILNDLWSALIVDDLNASVLFTDYQNPKEITDFHQESDRLCPILHK